jgi:hypothetical protein
MNRWRVGEDRGSEETDGCPLTETVMVVMTTAEKASADGDDGGDAGS